MTERVTLADIATKAGVHPTTVSLALRNHPSLPVKTRDRLQKLARQMGYQPDPALSALVTYRHRKRPRHEHPPLAYMTHWNTPWGWKSAYAHKAFFEGAEARASFLGYRLEHFWLGEPGLTHGRVSDILQSRGITGLIIASHLQDDAAPLELNWSRFSAVRIDFAPRTPRHHMVSNDQSAIIRLAFQRALASGYRRIGFVMPQWWDECVDQAWSAGFLVAQQQREPKERIPILSYSTKRHPIRPPSGKLDDQVPKPLLAEWMRAHRPQVILCHGPFILPRLAELGIKIPANVAFVEIFLSDFTGQTAGVRQNCLTVGEVAVELLVGQLHKNIIGVPAIPAVTLIEGTWFGGASLPPITPSTGIQP